MPPHRRYVAPWLPIIGLWAEWPGPLPLVESREDDDERASPEADREDTGSGTYEAKLQNPPGEAQPH